MKPRILFLDHVGVLGGAELSLLEIARHFRQSCRVVLFEDGSFARSLADAGVDVQVTLATEGVLRVTRDGGILQGLLSLPGVINLVRRVAGQAHDFDVVYANSQKAMIVAALAAFFARRRVVWHIRDLMTEEHFSRFHCRLATTISNLFVTRVLTNSHATRDAFVRQGGRAETAHVVYNGIDAAPFTMPTGASLTKIRAELDLGDAFAVGLFSRIAPWKGQHVLIEALNRLPDVHGVIVGSALFRADRAYEEYLKQLVEKYGIGDRVHFLGFRDDVPLLMQAMNVIAHTSTSPEPFGRVIVEGMLSGTPVIASQGGGCSEIVEHGKTGWLIPPGEPQALAAAIRRVMEDPLSASAVGTAGRQAASSRFSHTSMLAAVEGHVTQIVDDVQKAALGVATA